MVFCLVVVNDQPDLERQRVVQCSLVMLTITTNYWATLHCASSSANIPRGTSDTRPDDGGRKRVREDWGWVMNN